MQIAIIGMGSMGPGMAARLARGGHDVRAQDIAPTAIERAQTIQPMISEALDGLGGVGRGLGGSGRLWRALIFPLQLRATKGSIGAL